MPEKEMTAMRVVINKLQGAKDNFPAIGFNEEFVRGFYKAFDMAIIICENVGIPVERQQIIDAVSQNDFGLPRTISGESYFELKFTSPKNSPNKNNDNDSSNERTIYDLANRDH